ncbi:MAG: hypothetical protein ACJA1W_004168 [Akkermansiaceae bacterium]|jgi:hypothetical protein
MSGAGHKADQSLIFAKVNESVRSYGLPCHRPSLRSTPFLPPPLRSGPVQGRLQRLLPKSKFLAGS